MFIFHSMLADNYRIAIALEKLRMKKDVWQSEVDEYLAHPPRRTLEERRHRPIIRNASSAIALRDLRGHGEKQSIIEEVLETVDPNRKELMRKKLSYLVGNLHALNHGQSIRGPALRNFMKNLADNPIVENTILFDDGNHLSAHTDRYFRDYLQLSTLGKGAFGDVYKVRSKMDQCLYAVKKIKLNIRFAKKIRTEVIMMANLDSNPHIVRYYTAWAEVDSNTPLRSRRRSESCNEPKVVEILSDESDEHNSNSVSNPNNVDESVNESYNPSFATHSGDANKNHMANSKFYLPSGSSADEEDDTQPSSASSQSQLKMLDEVDLDEILDLQLPETTVKMANYLQGSGSQPVYLNIFIQMELCEKTLTQFLVERNHSINEEGLPVNFYNETFHYASNLMEAVKYLHDNSVIHRDIKPSNIFLVTSSNGNKILKLGDFGLACVDPLIQQQFKENSAAFEMVKTGDSGHSKGIGTALYAAPEQMKRKDYSIAADVYSCGLVIMEMFGVFHTDMQRVDHLERARQGFVPQYVFNISPELYHLLVTMLVQIADARPNADEVLRHIKELEKKTDTLKPCPIESRDANFIKQLQEENHLLRNQIAILQEHAEMEHRATTVRKFKNLQWENPW